MKKGLLLSFVLTINLLSMVAQDRVTGAPLVTRSEVLAQNDEAEIRSIRLASNAALKAYDHEMELSFLTDDCLLTTGAGTLLVGKAALRNYIEVSAPSKMYWVRSPLEIVVNAQNSLAWERGSWKGYDPEQGEHQVVGGNYAAQWTKADGIWKIHSELFVTLE